MLLISNFGDVAVLLPASFCLIVILFGYGSRRNAVAYAAALAMCLIIVVLAKLLLAACSGAYSAIGVESPSGHAAFSAVFYGCLAVLLGGRRSIGWRAIWYCGAAALIVAIGVSRVAIEAHTAQEVAIGLLIGSASILLFCALRGKQERIALSSRAVLQMSPLAVLYAACVLLLAGHWTAEPYIDAIAARIGADMHLCR